MYSPRFANKYREDGSRRWCQCDTHENLTGYWYEKVYTNAEVEKFRQARKLKDNYLAENYFQSDLRWLGDIGEDTFKSYLTELGLRYTHWTNAKTADLRDFTVGRLEIDVKCIGCDEYPHMGCQASVNAKQIEKIEQHGVVNCFAWTRFLHSENTCIIVGFLPKDIFDERKKLTPAGTRFNNGKTSVADMHGVKVECLYPPIFLDRYA